VHGLSGLFSSVGGRFAAVSQPFRSCLPCLFWRWPSGGDLPCVPQHGALPLRRGVQVHPPLGDAAALRACLRPLTACCGPDSVSAALTASCSPESLSATVYTLLRPREPAVALRVCLLRCTHCCDPGRVCSSLLRRTASASCWSVSDVASVGAAAALKPSGSTGRCCYGSTGHFLPLPPADRR